MVAGRAKKVFDELKNKVGETKAWASSATAKAMQANFLCLGHNLMLLCEAELEREHGIRNKAELARRAKRLQEEAEPLGKEGHVLPVLIETFQRLTQRSVKFVRWLRVQLFGAPQDRLNIWLLRRLYAALRGYLWTPLSSCDLKTPRFDLFGSFIVDRRFCGGDLHRRGVIQNNGRMDPPEWTGGKGGFGAGDAWWCWRCEGRSRDDDGEHQGRWALSHVGALQQSSEVARAVSCHGNGG